MALLHHFRDECLPSTLCFVDPIFNPYKGHLKTEKEPEAKSPESCKIGQCSSLKQSILWSCHNQERKADNSTMREELKVY